jgi:cell division protein FtsI (penicillin-binding protein 3)
MADSPPINRKGAGEKQVERYGEPLDAGHAQRVRIVSWSFFAVLGVIGLRLAQLHLNPHYELSKEEQSHIGTIELNAPRGEVYDRNGLMLATNVQMASVWVDPRKITDAEALAERLVRDLRVAPEEVHRRLRKTDDAGRIRKFEWIRRWVNDVPEETLDALVADSGGAIAIEREPVRLYPNGTAASHVLGFVNRSGEAAEGLELTFDKHLRSVAGRHQARKDGRRQLLSSLTLDYTEPTGGEDVITTLDLAIQRNLERVLARRMEETNAVRAMGMIMDAQSGAILALATVPNFDPNQYSDTDPAMRSNRALLDVFEPGSAFKIVVAAAALELGLISPETRFNCENGGFRAYGRYIRDYHSLGVEPFTRCFEESSNVAIIKIGTMLGEERLEHWIRRFGFGEATSRDFQLESRGIFRPRDRWSGFTMGSLPMGQEIAVTIPQLARSFAVIANGGHLVEPHVVDHVMDRRGEITYQYRPEARPRVISEHTAATMRDLCERVVLHGTGTRAAMAEYTSAGKTGTAQMQRKDGKGYDPDRFTAVFAGFAPARNPRLVGVIVVQEPMIKLHYGGYVCGPVFSEVMRDALVRLGVPQDKVVEAKNDAKAEAAPAAAPEVDADTVMSREELEKLAAMEDSLDHLLAPLDGLQLAGVRADGTGGGRGLPDFTGMTKREAKDLLAQLGIPWDPQGAGWVIRQEPPSGTPLNQVRLCALTFSNQRPAPEEHEAQRVDKAHLR